MPPQIRRQTLSSEVTEYLRRELIFGRIPAGTHLAETTLAHSLGVSSGPVREALRELERDGLVITHSNGRTVAAGFDEGALRDLYRVREQLECAAVELVVARAADAELESLARLARESVHALSEPDSIRQDLALHQELVRLSQNRFLQQAWELGHRTVRTILTETLVMGNSSRLERIRHRDHREITGALRKRDVSRALRAMRLHMEHAVQHALACMGKSG